MARKVLLAILCCVFPATAIARRAHWKEIFVPKNYSHNNPPEAAQVKCYIGPQVVTNMLMKEMEFVVDTIVSISWRDDRLIMPGKADIGDSSYWLPLPLASQVWTPKLAFLNSKGRDSSLIGSQAALILIHEENDPKNPIKISAVYRETRRFVCNYVFFAYPFDKQECDMQLLSGYKPGEIHLTVTNFAPGLTFKNISVPPEFHLHAFEKQECLLGSYDSKRYICLRFLFVFRRIYTHHMMTIFVPSVLIVTLSWISFWIEITAPAPRVTLGLTSLLTLATQFNTAQKDLPPVADVKAIDIWMFACMFMVFASLTEFAIANYKNSKPKSNVVNVTYVPKYVTITRHGILKRAAINRAFSSKFKITSATRKEKGLRCLFCSSSANRIDLTARVMFPAFFLIFNIVFWTYYLMKR